MPEFITLADGSLAVKGRNIFAGFTETIPDLWSNNSAIYPITSNIKSSSDGFICKRVSRSNPTLNPSVLTVYNTISGSHLTYQKLKGETVTMSCYVRASQATDANMMASFMNGNDTVVANGGSFAIGPEWRQIYRTVTLNFDMTDNGVVRLCPLNMTIPESQRDGSFWLEYSRLKIEFGSEPTPYSPAPEDEEVTT